MGERTIPEHISERLRKARRGAVLTGAGVSAESGIDTFRGVDGTWSKVNIYEVATPEGFAKDPEKVWQWYESRRIKIAEVQPNPAHLALAKMEDHLEEFSLITQNIDGLHRLAGTKNVIELHGNIWRMKDVETNTVVENRQVPLPAIPPLTKEGRLLRPDVVWFGELLPSDALQAAIAAASTCDLFLVVGTSAVVHPAAMLPIYAKQAGALVLEFNTEPTEITDLVDYSFFGKAGETLPPFLDLLVSGR